MAWFMYQVALALLLLCSAPFLMLRRGRHYFSTLGERLAPPKRAVESASRPLWMHAVSVGEVGVAAALAPSIADTTPLVVSTITPTGLQEACRLLGERADIRLHPFDFGFALNPFFDRVRPRALVIMEGDLWPLALHHARRRGLPIVVVNGRISDRNFARLRRLRPFARLLTEPVDFFAVQGPQDRDRLLALGVREDKVEVTGNLKFDTPTPARSPELEDALARLANGRPLLVAGSTMAGEEEVVLDAFERVGGDRALLLMAPRHPERWQGVTDLLERRGTSFVRRSELAAASHEDSQVPSVFLLDSLGELAGIYSSARGAFIGGTLVDTGGHNPLEPARFGTPVVVGPSMHNFPEIAGLFEAGDAWQRVEDAQGLARCWNTWVDDAEGAGRLGLEGEKIVAANRGALERTAAVLDRFVPGARA